MISSVWTTASAAQPCHDVFWFFGVLDVKVVEFFVGVQGGMSILLSKVFDIYRYICGVRYHYYIKILFLTLRTTLKHIRPFLIFYNQIWPNEIQLLFLKFWNFRSCICQTGVLKFMFCDYLPVFVWMEVSKIVKRYISYSNTK